MTVRLPSGKTAADGPFPTLIEYSGYQVAAPHDLLSTARQPGARPARARELDRRRLPDRAAARLRRRLRADARQRLLGRRLRPLRPADDLRRLRRRRDGRRPGLGEGRQGRHGRHLVLRHHAALHRRHAPAAPRRDRADVGHRRPLPRHGQPRRDPELGLRAHVDRGAPGRRAARAAGRPALRARARRARRPPLPPQPAPAPPDPGRGRAHGRTPQRAPKLYDDRSPGALDGPDPRPDVPRRLLPGRADQRPLRDAASAQAPQQPAHVAARCRTASTPTRSGRARSPAGWSSSSSTSPTRCRRVPDPVLGLSGAALHLPRRRARRARPAVALRRRHRRRRRAGHVRAGPARAAADGERRRPGRPRLDRRGVGARLRRVADPPRPSATDVLPRRGRRAHARGARRGHRRVPRRSRRAPGRRRCPATARRTRGRRSRPTTGRRSRTARASASPRRRCRRTS